MYLRTAFPDLLASDLFSCRIDVLGIEVFISGFLLPLFFSAPLGHFGSVLLFLNQSGVLPYIDFCSCTSS